MMRFLSLAILAVRLIAWSASARAEETPTKWPEHIQIVLDNTDPLKHGRGGRLPLYLWPAMNPGPVDDRQAETLARELDRRGVGLICAWDWSRKEQSLADALVVARAQQELGLLINVDATSCLYSFFDGDPRTAHVDAEGKPFWDPSFGPPNMGCPFAIDFRRPPIRERIESFAEAYRREGLRPGFVFADWEIDGPIEWNGAWEASKRCRRCREQVPDIGNFLSFQKALRELRADLQRDVYAEPLVARFPEVLVGNYGVYPNDGIRYWYDYFEKEMPGLPGLTDQGALYRHWASEFEGAGFTFAMPVVYTWERTWHWYDFEPSDYRWFHNMLRVATNAGKHTPRNVPVVSFVHWHTTAPPEPPNLAVRQMSENAYQELLWHMLLRGTDTFFLWCMPQEQAEEVRLLHPVWAAAQEYADFLDRGTPVCFDVPSRPGPVVSGLLLGDRMLVRRTDFGAPDAPVDLQVRGRTLRIPPSPGRCQILELESGTTAAAKRANATTWSACPGPSSRAGRKVFSSWPFPRCACRVASRPWRAVSRKPSGPTARWLIVCVSTGLVCGALSMDRAGLTLAADLPGAGPVTVDTVSLDQLEGQPVDIAPWAYAWRADRAAARVRARRPSCPGYARSHQVGLD